MANITAVRFTERDRQALEALAALRGTTVSGLVRAVLAAELRLYGLLPADPTTEPDDHFATSATVEPES